MGIYTTASYFVLMALTSLAAIPGTVYLIRFGVYHRVIGALTGR